MATISNTPRPGYAWDSTDNVWYPIGTGTHSHSEIAKTIVDAKGDIIAGTAADTVDRLAVGANDTVLTADSTTATGLKWATPAAGGMTVLASGTLSGASVTLSSISQTYNDLILRISNFYVNTTTGSLLIRVNNVSTADQHNGYSRSDSVTATSSVTNTGYRTNNVGTTITANGSIVELKWSNYAATGTVKPAQVITSNETAGSAIGTAVRIGSTAAITSLVIVDSNGSTFAGGTYTLYGVK
jgi:hypothetical protein